jgi:hypothetical protein
MTFSQLIEGVVDSLRHHQLPHFYGHDISFPSYAWMCLFWALMSAFFIFEPLYGGGGDQQSRNSRSSLVENNGTGTGTRNAASSITRWHFNELNESLGTPMFHVSVILCTVVAIPMVIDLLLDIPTTFSISFKSLKNNLLELFRYTKYSVRSMIKACSSCGRCENASCMNIDSFTYGANAGEPPRTAVERRYRQTATYLFLFVMYFSYQSVFILLQWNKSTASSEASSTS